MSAGNEFERLRAIEASKSLDQLGAEVRTLAKPLGYDRFIIASVSPATEELIDRIYWVDGNWLATEEQVDVDTYLRHCPITRHVIDTDTAFFWTKTRSAKGERYRVVSQPKGPGTHGIQIPIFGRIGLEGAASFAGESVDTTSKTRFLLSMTAVIAFRTIRRIVGAASGPTLGKLSKREAEVLAWVASGRRQADVAATLGLSDRTIENHMRRIRHRLGAATTAEAVRIAARDGYINH